MNATTLARLVGNPDVYALQQPDGTYLPIRESLDESMLVRHLEGEVSIGTYVNVKDEAKVVVFDIDSGNQDDADAVRFACEELGVPPYAIGLEYSGRKGYHVWVLFQGFKSANLLRRFGRAVLALANVQCEVFPKQDEVRDLGNLVKLPEGVHRVSGRRSYWMGNEPRPMPDAVWEDHIIPELPEDTGRAFAQQEARFPCMEHILSEGCAEGSRNIQLFHLATMLRRAGLTEEYVDSIIASVNEKGDPVDDTELRALLASSAVSGPICDQLPQERQCGDLCIKARTKGLYTRPGQLRHASVGENVVVQLGSRAGRTVTFEHDDLQTGKGALRG